MTGRYAFKMFLNPGCAAEHRRRHDVIWPELVRLLTEAGVANYSIHFDQETSILFAFLQRGEDHRMEAPARPTGDAPLVGIT
jgi:L-rhamnose mutarotase